MTNPPFTQGPSTMPTMPSTTAATMKYDDVKVGDILIADDGFTCLAPGAKCEVKADSDGKYIECIYGQHYLDGQADGRDVLIGLSRPAKEEAAVQS